jgi:hypothetical protein
MPLFIDLNFSSRGNGIKTDNNVLGGLEIGKYDV